MTLDRARGFAQSLPALLVQAARVADTVLQGTHGRRRVGLGESFWQFREYGIGDSAARIDWRQSGRSTKLFVRETEWEAAHSLWLWRDGSASMDYASQGSLPTKRAHADLLMLAVAAMALRAGERVGVLNALGQPPSTSPAGLERLAILLAGLRSAHDEPPSPAAVKRHSTIVLCGDFLGSLDPLTRTMQDLTALQARGILVQVLDPAEIDLPFRGRVRFEGLEGEAAETAPRVEAIALDYKTRLAERQRALERIARQAGWHMVFARTDATPYDTLIELHTLLSGKAR